MRYKDTHGTQKNETIAGDADPSQPKHTNSRARFVEPKSEPGDKIMVDDGSYNDEDAKRGYRSV